MTKIHITSLGCAKNLVDSEVLAGQLHFRDYEMTPSAEQADVVIINTCGFIDAAKTESIQAIFEAVELKQKNRHQKVFVTGCLSQRYKDSLKKEIPELDGIFGTEDYKNILASLGENQFHPENMYQMRQISTPHHFAFLKMSEGCNHTCAFCAIPSIRGKHRSRTIDNIMREAEVLAHQGVKELLLVSQDTSYYGRDLYGSYRIVDLLEDLAKSGLFRWIRPLYWYPTNFPFEFIDLMQDYDCILPYVDMPIQHASDVVLRHMRRAETNDQLRHLYKRMRTVIPEITLRTTLILGHPGESERDFSELLDFIQEIRFDRVGTFLYSDEEGTHAYDIKHKVDWDTAIRRRDTLMEIQQQISLERNQSLTGTNQTVLIDSWQKNEGYYVGRTWRDAPEIDNEVVVRSDTFDPNRIGSFFEVIIDDVTEYELYGRFNVLENNKCAG
jgi:ribosomal protein S12 methylthiotransferase